MKNYRDNVGTGTDLGKGALARPTGAKHRLHAISCHVSAGLALLHSTLREIFDEAAYERFLRHTAAPRSAASYAAFTNHIRSHRERRPRCC